MVYSSVQFVVYFSYCTISSFTQSAIKTIVFISSCSHRKIHSQPSDYINVLYSFCSCSKWFSFKCSTTSVSIPLFIYANSQCYCLNEFQPIVRTSYAYMHTKVHTHSVDKCFQHSCALPMRTENKFTVTGNCVMDLLDNSIAISI